MAKHGKQRDNSEGITLNSGRQYAIKGNCIHGYTVVDTTTDNVVFSSEYVQECHTWREQNRVV